MLKSQWFWYKSISEFINTTIQMIIIVSNVSDYQSWNEFESSTFDSESDDINLFQNL